MYFFSISISVSRKQIIRKLCDQGCETWSLTLRGERRLRVFENRVLRRIFGPKRDEVNLTNQNSIHEDIKSRLKSANACYLSVQNLLSSSSLSKSVKIKICRIIILPVVLYDCETWSVPLREECRLRVSENRVLRRIFGPKRDEATGEWRRSFILYTPHQISFG
jgi:hypothetical protein